MTNTNIETSADSMNDDDLLLAALLGNDGEIDETIDDIDSVLEADIEAACADIEKADATYADSEVLSEEISEADAPLTSPDAIDAPKKSKKAAKPAKEPKAAKPAKEPKAAKEPKEPKPAKEPKEPRIGYVGHAASEVLTSRLGKENVAGMLLLETSDAELSEEDLATQQADLMALLNSRPAIDGTNKGSSTQKKVAEKVVMLFSWMKNGGKLNEVMKRTFEVLARDGEIISGEKGNLHAELLAKPYSDGTCRAQAGQMMAMLPMLKIAIKGAKGQLVENPESLLLMKIKADLGI